MRTEEFRTWLRARIYNGAPLSPKATEQRIHWARRVERELPAMGAKAETLDGLTNPAGEEWLQDRFQTYLRDPSQMPASLVPQAAEPSKQLENLQKAARMYLRFARGEDPNGALSSDHETEEGADEFLLFDAEGRAYRPVTNRNRTTGHVAYRIQPQNGSNRTEDAIEVTTLTEVARAVLLENRSARIAPVNGGTDNYLGYGKQKLISYQLDPDIAEELGIPAIGQAQRPFLSELDRFRKNADFRRAESAWTPDQREAFIRLAQDVHDVGLDWWFVDIAHTPVRFGRKDKGNAKAHAVIGYLRAAEARFNLNTRQDALPLSSGEGFALEERSVNAFNATLSRNIEAIARKLPTSFPRSGLWPDELTMESEYPILEPTPVWIVTARWGAEDGVQHFVDRGEWSLLTDTGSANNDRMRQMQPGDRIVMRDYFHQSQGLPFEANGARISAIRIRAMGTVTEQRGDGLSVGVDWETPLPEPRVWYFYTQNDPVWCLKEPGESPLADRLRAFLLDGAEQDYAYFLDQWFGGERPMPSPTNLILYGPPGTGKTYTTAREAVRLCGEAVPEDRDALMALYRSLQHKGRIGFVTFHQNFAYEDFVEGLRPVTGDGGEAGAGFGLSPEPGVFRRIADMAARPAASEAAFSFEGRRIFKLSLGESGKAAWNWVYEQSIEDGYALFGFRDVDWSDEEFSRRDAILAELQGLFPDENITPQTGIVKSPDRFRNQIGIGDVVIISKGLNAFRAIGVVEGEYEYAPREGGSYCHRRKVRWLWEEPEGVPVGEISATRFSLDTVYELPRERLNLDVLLRYIAGADEEARGSGTVLPHVLIIDEINRANISKVFGELITLLEPDKRLGMPNALTVRLPYSKTEFGVPANLHVIGTMNTADRSIALLDTALRRRFDFREMAPDPSLLGTVEGIALPRVLSTINERIEYLVDREHRIGHAFFIHCATRAQVDGVMRDKVIPLLQEYFFEDWSSIAAVVGPGFIGKRRLKPPPGITGDDVASWYVRPVFADDAYASLLGGVEVVPDEGTGGEMPINEMAGDETPQAVE